MVSRTENRSNRAKMKGGAVFASYKLCTFIPLGHVTSPGTFPGAGLSVVTYRTWAGFQPPFISL